MYPYLVFLNEVYQREYKEKIKRYLYGLFVGIDLLARLLTFDYRKRPTAEQALGKRLEKNDELASFKSILDFST